MDDSRLVFGIDLGTTYSCVSQVDKFDQAIVLKNFEGDATTPSVIYIDGENVVVGKEAKELSKLEPEKTVSFVKRSISTDDAYTKPTKFPNGLDPTEISAFILKKIVTDANNAGQYPQPIKDVVITCPAYFGTKERLRTKQAGEIAGLNVLAIINEPTAAAIAYGMKVQEQKVILVYDLGGGTFDVTLIRVNGGTITVIATGGDHHLGGVDWDMALAEYLLSRYNKEHGTSHTLDSDPILKNTLLLLAEEQKKRLSAKDTVNSVVTFEGNSSRIVVTRAIFDQLTAFKLDETIEKTKEVVEIAKEKGFTRIDEVLLVGGSSRMPQIKARVDKELGCNAKLTDPDECVAKGAAIYAMNEAYAKASEEYAEGTRDEKPQSIGLVNRTKVLNVTSKTYGIGCTDVYNNKEMVSNLIFANSPLNGNCKASEMFYTVYDNQPGVLLPVYESDVTNVETDKIIEPQMAVAMEGDKPRELKLSKNYPQGTPVEVVFEIDIEGILHVHGEVGKDSIDFDMKIKGVKNNNELAKSAALLAKSNVQ
ncbi:MAG: Hsp70 family protein [Tannerellaceae bacterium]|jgi:molecular chaperone DnaK (HSP70)|nr:Hsp70 family protein [Tannerellaceae bacterium]